MSSGQPDTKSDTGGKWAVDRDTLLAAEIGVPAPSLSHQSGKGHKKRIGSHVGADGKPRERVWWLGRDKYLAEHLARRILVYHRICRERGMIHWEPSALAFIEGHLEGMRRDYAGFLPVAASINRVTADVLQSAGLPLLAVVTQADQSRAGMPPALPPAAKGTPMLHAALDAYVESVKASPRADNYKDGIGDSMEAWKRYCPDCPLSHVDYLFLESATNRTKARPLCSNKNRRTGKREPIKPHTVQRLLQHARQAFKWIHKARQSDRFGGWRMPEDAVELFSVKLDQIRSKLERDKTADGPIQLAIQQIVRLYRDGIHPDNDEHRAWFLCGLFAGQAQKELSTARQDEFNLTAGTYTHRRNKTGQQGVYWLPPELVELLKAHFAKGRTDAEGTAFLTADGSKLVTKKSDAVRQAFDDWKARAKVELEPFVGFKALRRYFGDVATRRGGESLRDAALAHSAKTVGAKHYSNHRDFDAVAVVGQEIYAALKAVGMFDEPAKGKATETAQAA